MSEEEIFPTDEVEKLNIFANYFPSNGGGGGGMLCYDGNNGSNLLFQGNNHGFINNQQQYYTFEQHQQLQLQQHHQHQQLLHHEYDGWYDQPHNEQPHLHHHPHHHHHQNHNQQHQQQHSAHTLDLSHAHTLKSNLLKLLSDGRTVLLSRIPIMYRTKFGREFRDDIDVDGKIKLIDVFQALGSPFLLFGEGGFASVRRDLPSWHTPQTIPPYKATSEYINNNFNNYQPTGNLERWQRPRAQSSSASTPSTSASSGATSATPTTSTTSSSTTTTVPVATSVSAPTLTSSGVVNFPTLSPQEAQIRLKNNLEILLEDGKPIYLADLPVAYKSRFGLDYRDGLEFRGRIKLQRLFLNYGFPFILEGIGLEATVRKSNGSAWYHTSKSSTTNALFLDSPSSQSVPPLPSPPTTSLNLPSLVSPMTCHFPASSSSSSHLSDVLQSQNHESFDSNSTLLSHLKYLTSSDLSPNSGNEINSNQNFIPSIHILEDNVETLPISSPPPLPPLSRIPLSSSSSLGCGELPLLLKRNSSEYPTNQPILTPHLSSHSHTTTSTISLHSILPVSSSIIIDHLKWNKSLDIGYLGILKDDSLLSSTVGNNSLIHTFFNSTNPFCIVCIGQPGSGVSHTLNILLENCLMTSSLPIKSIHHTSLNYPYDYTQSTNELFHEEYQHDDEIELESIAIPRVEDSFHPILIQSQSKICTLSFHSNHQNISSIDMPAGISLYQSYLQMRNDPRPINAHGMAKVIILVSPTYYMQRKKYYHELDPHYVVLPLIFQWSQLNINQIKKLMRLYENSNDHPSQQYPSCLVDILKEYQTKNQPLPYEEYCRLIFLHSDISWREWIQKRLNFMKYFIDEYYQNGNINTHTTSSPGTTSTSTTPNTLNFSEIFQPGHLILCDMTDPSLSQEESTSIYQIILNIFRCYPIHNNDNENNEGEGAGEGEGDCHKLIIIDNMYQNLHRIGYNSQRNLSTNCSFQSFDSHLNHSKYEFALEIIDLIRHFNKEKMRIILTAQSPLDIPADILEFATLTVLHQFQSQDGFDYLQSKLPLHFNHFHEIRKLQIGQALLVTCKGNIDSPMCNLDNSQHDQYQSHGNESTSTLRNQYVYPILIRDKFMNL